MDMSNMLIAKWEELPKPVKKILNLMFDTYRYLRIDVENIKSV